MFCVHGITWAGPSEKASSNINKMNRFRARGYKTFFMLNSAEHEICPANISQITNNCKFFLARYAEHETFSANKYKNAKSQIMVKRC